MSLSFSPDSSHPLRVEGTLLSGHVPPARSPMFRSMSVVREDDQVLRSVVGLDVIDVVNDFRPKQGSTKLFFHDQSVLSYISPVRPGMARPANEHIAEVIDIATRATLDAAVPVMTDEPLIRVRQFPAATLAGMGLLPMARPALSARHRKMMAVGIPGHGVARVHRLAAAASACRHSGRALKPSVKRGQMVARDEAGAWVRGVGNSATTTGAFHSVDHNILLRGLQ